MRQRLAWSAPGRDTLASTGWGLAAATALIAGIVVGSRRFKDFDPALVAYAGASVFAAFGIGYRYSMWPRRPPTRLYWFRGLQIFFHPRHLGGNLVHLARLFWDNFVVQRFIERRSHLRWVAHGLIAWGCLLAAAITFPLSFGWVRFETPPDSQEVYRAYAFGVHLSSFRLDSPLATLTFNILNIAAVMVIAGVILALWRRANDGGALAVQQFANDLLPLILLFAVSVTGLLLTASAHWLRGFHYGVLAQFHAVTVILTLVYLPFGKFFHIFQRPAQLGVNFYRRVAAPEPASCRRCGGAFAARLHVEDLKQVEAALGIRYQLGSGAHYQDVCPSCRRQTLALVQDGLWRAARADAQELRDGAAAP
ncbi:MAG TPA: hypothetical protein VF590_02350 [Isosphaeraceae bacterium]|jgi:hypothetical protein